MEPCANALDSATTLAKPLYNQLMTAHAIEIQNVTRRFGETVAVDQLSLTIDAGEVFGILGHNGAGKTTTVRLLNGVLTPDTGTLRVLGLDPQDAGAQLRKLTGVLTETPSVDERLTAYDNLAIFADLYSIPHANVEQRIDAVLGQFGLRDRSAERVGGYSKGMKQRLALARAFLHEPQLMFLDEPTSGLDPIAIQDVHKLIRQMSRDEGRTVVLCTHNLVEAQRLCDRVAVIERGRLVAVGSPRELAQTVGAEVRYRVEISADQQPHAQHLLEQFAEITNLVVSEQSFNFTLRDRETVPQLLARLVAQDIRVYAIEPQQPALEDIYVALHQERG